MQSRSAKSKMFLTALALFHVLIVAPAGAWYNKGHRIVGLIAEANLTDAARAATKRILPPGMTLADAAVWPDHEGRSIRELDPLHYVSIPDHAVSYDQLRDCPEKNCMVEALDWFFAALADLKAPNMVRRIALYYVVHLLGDMHQPLHTGRAEDRGGVEIPVSYRGQSTNLHFFWDTDLVEMEPGTAEEVARRLNGNVTENERREWQAGDARLWTDESLKLVRSYVYKTESALSDEYVDNARPIVRRRLAQAGIRLAWLLNRALK
jgi:hypothetical protein